MRILASKGKDRDRIRTIRISIAALAVAVAGCNSDGGSGSGSAAGGAGAAAHSRLPFTVGSGTARISAASAVSTAAVSADEASRFLAQASMGASEEDIASVQALGYTGWIESQLKQPQTLAQTYVETVAAKLGVGYWGAFLPPGVIYNAFWSRIGGPDQLRQRVAWALSQIFVISVQVNALAQMQRGVANYLDMLGRDAFGNFRTLLEDVTLHPAMGQYLSNFMNISDPIHNIFPNQNYAREVMQLFTIGLVQLNADGTPKLVNGQPVPTYGQADIIGLSHVFTGFGWYSPSPDLASWSGTSIDPNRDIKPMSAYQWHSTVEKKFLGVDIPAQSSANAMADLKIALDTLFNHPNVGPFIGRQLIQRMVTSNPSAAYVGRVAQAFNTGSFSAGSWKVGSGSRGDMLATVAAVLLDPEARDMTKMSDSRFGRVREPVLRTTAWMRAFHVKSPSGFFSLWDTGNPAHALDMSPMDSPSVFNFYMPDFSPAGSALSGAGLAAPELQITNASSVVGYANYIRQLASSQGANGDPDVFAGYDKETAIAADPASLVNRLNELLAYGSLSSTSQNLILDAVNAVPLPAGDASTALRQRVWVAVTLALCAPEFIVQK